MPTATSGLIGVAGTTFGLTTINANGTGEVPVPPANGGLTAAVFKNLNIPAIVQLSQQDQSVAFIAGPLVTTNDNCKATVDISEERQTQSVHHLARRPDQRRHGRPAGHGQHFAGDHPAHQ